MRITRPAVVALGLLVPLAALAGFSAADAPAAPRIILLYDGPLLDQRVYMTDWSENLEFMLATTGSADGDAEELERLPAIRAALFWHGPTWERYVTGPERLEMLRPDFAEQHAWIYPASGSRGALFVFESVSAPHARLVRRLGSGGVEILRQHGVPMETSP